MAQKTTNGSGSDPKVIQGQFPVRGPLPQKPAQKLHGDPAAIIALLEREIPVLKEGKVQPRSGEEVKLRRLTPADVSALAERSDEDILDILKYYFATIKYLNQPSSQGSSEPLDGVSRDLLFENAARILSHEKWKVYQLHECVQEFEDPAPRHLFLENYLPNMDKHIYWRPFIEHLNEYDSDSVLQILLWGEDFTQYLQRWDGSVAMAEEAVCAYGLNQLASILFGKALVVKIGKDESFCTTPDGQVFIPPFVNLYDDKATNLIHYLVSTLHENGHHESGTFEISMSPDVFDYASFGVEYLGKEKHGDRTVFRVRKLDGGEVVELAELSDIEGLVKYPLLLHFLHNVLDDGRVDANNIEAYPYIADEYRRDCNFLFDKRPKMEGDGLAAMLELILQYGIIGRIRGSASTELMAKDVGNACTVLAELAEKVTFANPHEATAFKASVAAATESLEALRKRLQLFDGEVDGLTDLVSTVQQRMAFIANALKSENATVPKELKAQFATVLNQLKPMQEKLGKLNGEVPDKLKATFERAKAIMDNVEYGIGTNGTSSLNASILLYRLLEKDLEDLVKKMKEQDLPGCHRDSKTGKDGSGQPQLTSKKPGGKGKRGKAGINPLQFAPQEGEGEEGDGDPQGGGRPGKPGSGKSVGKGSSGVHNPNQGKKDGASDTGKKPGEDGKKKGAGLGEDEDEDGNPVQGKKGRQGEEVFTYDGFNGQKKTAGEHVVVEMPADGASVWPPAQEVERIKRIFRKYAPKQGVLVRGLYEGDIDAELFQEFMDQMQRGRIPEMDFYQRVVYEERDVATGVLVDLTGSEAHVRDEILQGCSILAIASEELHDPCFVGGFEGSLGDEHFVRLKGLRDKEVKNTSHSGSTPIGGPIKHMTWHMSQPGIGHKNFKQIFLFTDCDANISKSGSTEDAIADAKNAIEEGWKKHHIKTFGIGIYDGEHDLQRMEPNFKTIFGTGNYLLVPVEKVRAGYLNYFFERYYRKTLGKMR